MDPKSKRQKDNKTTRILGLPQMDALTKVTIAEGQQFPHQISQDCDSLIEDMVSYFLIQFQDGQLK